MRKGKGKGKGKRKRVHVSRVNTKPSMALNGLVIFKCFWTAPSAFSFRGHPDAVAGESPSLAQQRVPPSSHRPTHWCSMACYLLRYSGLCEADQNLFLALSLWSSLVAVSLSPLGRTHGLFLVVVPAVQPAAVTLLGRTG